MTTRNAIIGAILLTLALVGGISFYAHWELKRFTASLPMPPAAVPTQEHTGTEKQLPKTGDVSVDSHSETEAVVDDTVEQLADVPAALPAETDIGETENVPWLEGTPAEILIEAVRNSPFGFGSYPDVPPDFPLIVSWNRPEEVMARFSEDIRMKFELMDRVFIKLWNQGHTALNGGTFENGLVLPLYPNTAYVRYEEDWQEEEYGDSYTVNPQILADSSVSEQEKARIRKGEKPQGLRILDFDLDGINPYTFLELPAGTF